MGGKLKYLLTGLIVLIAVIVVVLKYWGYVTNPWTRDGQVRAQVIQITPRVSGPLVKLPVESKRWRNKSRLPRRMLRPPTPPSSRRRPR